MKSSALPVTNTFIDVTIDKVVIGMIVEIKEQYTTVRHPLSLQLHQPITGQITAEIASTV
jgi:hypothetical protein